MAQILQLHTFCEINLFENDANPKKNIICDETLDNDAFQSKANNFLKHLAVIEIDAYPVKAYI